AESSDAPKVSVPKVYVRYAVSLIQEYDTNKDQMLDKAEWSKMAKDPSAADTNKDGKITPDELGLYKFKTGG
ncbi:MAG: hypothetical protein KDB14_28750, partial [Planctomycetales bacterium]|nr:hypothetical protein [Planctomycetales bacterium]